MKKSLTKFAKQEINIIHGYSRLYNKSKRKKHAFILLKLMDEHIKEIDQRWKKGDKHYLIETGDLLILCFELIKEARMPIDAVLDKCYKRYRKKLPQLIKETRKKL